MTVVVMICVDCGTLVPDHDRVCPRCGADISDRRNRAEAVLSETDVRKLRHILEA